MTEESLLLVTDSVPRPIQQAQQLVEPDSLTVNYLTVRTIGLKACIDKVVERSRFRERWQSLPEGRGVGLACSSYLSGAGLPIYWNAMPHSGVQLRLDRMGAVTAFCGATEIGQGTNTVFSQIAADALGIDYEFVEVARPDTSQVPDSGPTVASRTTMVVGKLVADAALGQEAVNVAKTFHERLSLTGIVLTKVDGDARGGAALSMKKVTGAPIKFMGVGEKIDEFEVFHPDRIASRILGMGDVVSLVEKAQENLDQDESMRMAEKMLKAEFDFEDFLSQMKQMKKLGSMGSIAKMLPGMNNVQVGDAEEKALGRHEAIILSMTKEERRLPRIIGGSRRKRIADGAGVQIKDVNQLIKQFSQMQKMMKKMKGGGMQRMMRGLGGLGGGPGGDMPPGIPRR